ncbi:CBR-HIM-4 protein, partial [Aphelenchoides avenae]
IDECEVDNGGCSDTCVNKLEGHECRCPPGTRLTSDQRTCVEASPPSARIHPKNLHAIEGETFNLTCDVDGKPTPEPIWFFNGNRLYPGAKYDMTNRNELFVRGATIHDAGVYKCWARNLAGYKSDFATVKLAVPPSVHVVQTQQLVVRGDVVSLDCRANAGSPSPKFTWSKDGRVLTTTPHLHVEEARLTIR